MICYANLKKTGAILYVFCFSILLFSLFFGDVHADKREHKNNQFSGFFERRAEGWFWYIDPEPEPEEAEFKEHLQQHLSSPSFIDPKEQLKLFQEKLEQAQAAAVMNPTDKAAVLEMMRLQKQVSDNAEQLATTWQQLVWANPDLDASVQNPINSQSLKIYKEEERYLLETFLTSTAKTHGLWFFYRSDCPFCMQFSPILGSFAAKYGFEVLPISQDGGYLPGFPDYVLDDGHSQMLGVEVVPSVYLIEPETMMFYPIAHGLIGPNELENRIYISLEGQNPNPLNTNFDYRNANAGRQ